MNDERATFLMANLGSEVARLLHARDERNTERRHGAYTRACEILREVRALPEVKGAQKEFTILQTVLDDCMRKFPKFHIRPQSMRQYFMPFALRALSKQHIF